jgi:hypothetical protein
MVAIDENTCPNSTNIDVAFVPEKVFEVLKSKVAKGSSVTIKEADSLVNWDCKNSETVIPVDMNGAGANLDDFEAALKELGAKKIVECFIKAHKHFEATKHKIPEEELPKPMTAKEWKVENDEDDEEEEDEAPRYLADLFHVPTKAWEAIKVKFAANQEITKDEADALVNWTAPDSELLVPVDMNGTDEDLDDFEEMLEQLGPRKIVECFVQAEKHLEKKRDLIPAEKLKVITIGQWNKTNDDDEEEEAHEEQAAEEEEDEDDSEDGEDDEDDEPSTKKAKTE